MSHTVKSVQYEGIIPPWLIGDLSARLTSRSVRHAGHWEHGYRHQGHRRDGHFGCESGAMWRLAAGASVCSDCTRGTYSASTGLCHGPLCSASLACVPLQNIVKV
jgi:hypothetical protein